MGNNFRRVKKTNRGRNRTGKSGELGRREFGTNQKANYA
jgi:hypothetical protein